MFLGNCTTTVKAFFLFITFDLMQSYENRDLQSFLPTNLSINPQTPNLAINLHEAHCQGNGKLF
jgi:hypothetical protein